jgi:cobalt transporter subunit CbtA
MLRRILLTALVAGSLAGIAAAVLQQAKTIPLILRAEVYETAAALEHQHHHEMAGSQAPDATSAEPEDEGWEPAPGFERIAYTVLADILAGVGFGLMLTGAFTLYGVAGGEIDARRGLLWGLAGFAVFSVAPGLGLPPELPGMSAAALGDRQAWWLATALATAAGLGLVVFANRLPWPLPLRLLGVGFLLLPHMVGAPHPAEETGGVPAGLAAEFVMASLAAAAAFWLVLGSVGGWLYRRLA